MVWPERNSLLSHQCRPSGTNWCHLLCSGKKKKKAKMFTKKINKLNFFHCIFLDAWFRCLSVVQSLKCDFKWCLIEEIWSKDPDYNKQPKQLWLIFSLFPFQNDGDESDTVTALCQMNGTHTRRSITFEARALTGLDAVGLPWWGTKEFSIESGSCPAFFWSVEGKR